MTDSAALEALRVLVSESQTSLMRSIQDMQTKLHDIELKLAAIPDVQGVESRLRGVEDELNRGRGFILAVGVLWGIAVVVLSNLDRLAGL